MKSIKDFPIQIKKKNKRRGRPTKEEYAMTAFLSWYIKQPEHQNFIRNKIENFIFYGEF